MKSIIHNSALYLTLVKATLTLDIILSDSGNV